MTCAWKWAYVGSRLILYCSFDLGGKVSGAACGIMMTRQNLQIRIYLFQGTYVSFDHWEYFVKATGCLGTYSSRLRGSQTRKYGRQDIL